RTTATSLPDAATPFVGRDAEIAAALRLLEHARLVTLTGAAGCGKSRLAIEVARAWSARLGGEALFVDLTAATDAGDVAAAVAAALGTNDHSNAGLGAMLARR